MSQFGLSKSLRGPALGLVMLCASMAASAQAAIIDLDSNPLVQTHPDITTSFVTVDYTLIESDGTLIATIATGNQTIDADGIEGVEHNLTSSTFRVEINFDNGVVIGGNVSIGGSLDGAPIDVLLESSELAGFGYDELSGNFEFLFDGVATSLPGFGSTLGIMLHPEFMFGAPQDFSVPFSNFGPFGDADSFSITAVPEPSTIFMWAISSCLAGYLGWRRRPVLC